MKTTSEGEDWFLLFKRGNEDAFREVFERYYRSVRFYARKILNDDMYVEDIISDTFRKAWDARGRFVSCRHLENFLYMVARNGCISHMRKQKMMKSGNEDWVYLAAEPETGLPTDLERAQARLMEVIFEKMAGLPGGEILRMAFIEGKSTKQIAEELNITENNVYLIKSRSLKTLRAMVKGTG